MTKNYTDSFTNSTNIQKNKPNPETVSFLINYSKSFDIKKGKSIKEIRLEKN
ncbi:hypothetical protein [Wenyingzhuangia sp. IMCC45574]